MTSIAEFASIAPWASRVTSANSAIEEGPAARGRETGVRPLRLCALRASSGQLGELSGRHRDDEKRGELEQILSAWNVEGVGGRQKEEVDRQRGQGRRQQRRPRAMERGHEQHR